MINFGNTIYISITANLMNRNSALDVRLLIISFLWRCEAQEVEGQRTKLTYLVRSATSRSLLPMKVTCELTCECVVSTC